MLDRASWTYDSAAHLLRRAGFGGTPSEIGRAVQDGCESTVDRLLAAGEPEGADRSGADLTSFIGIQQWWVHRLLHTTRPLVERMTLFWHGHFATSIATVKDASLMLAQNQTFRAHALGNVRELTVAMARDPAMLLWLDNYLNRKGHPNENFGRELLELFLLGIGHYSEEDVMSSVRAFTGWNMDEERRFVFRADAHDADPKTFLGQKGAWNGDDLARLACADPAHARFLAQKLFAYFAYDDAEAPLLDRLAKIYLDRDAELKPLLRAILTAPEMYSEKARWTRVKSPVDHAIIACRQLQLGLDPLPVIGTLGDQGLSLFAPPDVSGWDGGMQWINSWSLLMRMKFAADVARSFDPARGTGGRSFADAGELVSFYLHLLGPMDVPPAARERLARYVAPGGVFPAMAQSAERQRGLVRLILSMPEWQLN